MLDPKCFLGQALLNNSVPDDEGKGRSLSFGDLIT